MPETIERLEYRVKILERFHRKYEPIIEEIVQERIVEKAVRDAVQKNNKIYLTWTQRIGAGIVVALTVGHLRSDNHYTIYSDRETREIDTEYLYELYDEIEFWRMNADETLLDFSRKYVAAKKELRKL